MGSPDLVVPSACFAVADLACPPSLGIDVKVVPTQGVTTYTVRFENSQRLSSTSNVLALRHRFKMRRVDAGAVATEVVDNQVLGNRPYMQLPGNTMRILASSVP